MWPLNASSSTYPLAAIAGGDGIGAVGAATLAWVVATLSDRYKVQLTANSERRRYLFCIRLGNYVNKVGPVYRVPSLPSSQGRTF